jgi:Protein of unknown function (DUF669)
MKIRPDFSETQDIAGMPAGIYKLCVVGMELKKSKNTGNEYLSWQFEVRGDKNFNGRKVFTNTVTSGAGAFMLKKFLTALDPNYAGGEIDTGKLFGKSMEGKLGYQKDKQTGELGQYPVVLDAFPLPDSMPGVGPQHQQAFPSGQVGPHQSNDSWDGDDVAL